MRASSFLLDRGVEEYAASAELLLQHVLGVSRTRLLTLWSDPIDDDAFVVLWDLVQRRVTREPVQYIVGQSHFYGRSFKVTRDVLIPRPETELLVERVISLGSGLWGGEAGGSPRVADIGTGSGAIAVTLAAEKPEWRIAATDISSRALQVAGDNAERNGVGGRVLLLEGDLLEPAVREWGGIDVLVSNPPYIATRDLDGLQREVKEFEPLIALDGGEDGLALYRRMLGQMESFGVWPRLVAFEVGLGQARELEGMLRAAGRWARIDTVLDWAGIERHVTGIRESF